MLAGTACAGGVQGGTTGRPIWRTTKVPAPIRGWVAKLDATGTVEWLTELGGHPLDGNHFLAGLSNAGRLEWVRSFERVAALTPVDASQLIVCTNQALVAVSGALPEALETPTRLSNVRGPTAAGAARALQASISGVFQDVRCRRSGRVGEGPDVRRAADADALYWEPCGIRVELGPPSSPTC